MITTTRILELASLAVTEYVTSVELVGESNVTPFEDWIEKCANETPEIALHKQARKIFVRKATEFFMRYWPEEEK